LAGGWLRAADVTAPLDPSKRSSEFSAEGTVTPDKRQPETNARVQDKRVEPAKVDRQPAAVGDKRAPIEPGETREKRVVEKEARQPEKIEQPDSRYNHREAKVSTTEDTRKPPLVAKYQDGLAAASASNMARFPALDQATGAKLNRFVFRKNPEEPGSAVSGAPVTPAAGGSAPAR
jgi:hypothetical protein